jgi:hypothetical protein
MSAGIDDLSPANQELLMGMLREVLREFGFDVYDLCVFASALGSGKVLTPEDSKKLHDIARRVHGLARVQHRDD